MTRQIRWLIPTGALLALALLSFAAWYYFYSFNLTTIYNDAMSHLNISRLVMDNKQPGLSQLGSVWLPLSQLLMLPFVWNDFLWHSGLAGAIVSMTSFIVSAVAVYKIVVELTKSKGAGYIGAIALAVNANLLYLQSTALTEPLYLAIFTVSTYYLVRYLKYDSSKSLIALAIVSFLGILTRYDAWFVAFIFGVIIVIHELFIKKRSIQQSFGHFTLYLFPILFGVVLWLGWNLLIFGDPLYSFIGPYSAHAQQAAIEQSSGLITKYNIGESMWAYGLATYRNIGLIIIEFGLVGWGLFLLFNKTTRVSVRWLAAIALFSIILFNVIALFFGFSILNLPELNWNPSGTLAGSLFNVRYGILALPFIAVGFGLFFAHVHILRYARAGAAILLVGLVGLQFYLTVHEGLITVQDGMVGSSAFVNQDIASALRDDVKPGDNVIMSTSSYNAVAFQSGLDLDQFIHEGVSKDWNGAISEPDKYAKWIVMANNNIGEPVHNSLVNKYNNAFLEKYKLRYRGTYASLYARDF